MIPQEKLEEIRKAIQTAQKPLFLFDDDCDGMCAFLILKTLNDNSLGYGLTGPPIITRQHVSTVEMRNPDVIIILDIGDVGQDFIDEITIPIIWLDHHTLQDRTGIDYCNPRKWDPKNHKATSHWAYQIAEEKLWLAATGIVADWMIPDNAKEIQEKFPGYLDDISSAPAALFNTKFGKLTLIVDFCIKGLDKSPLQIANALNKIEHPDEIFNQSSPAGKFLFKRAEPKFKEYENLLKQARTCYDKESPIFLFRYTEQANSYTRYVSNRMTYEFPDKLIIVARTKADDIKLSLRCTEKTDIDIPELLNFVFKELSGYGGGHKYACGASVKVKDFDKFLEKVQQHIKTQRNL